MAILNELEVATYAQGASRPEFHQSQKLVHCLTRNQNEETRSRLVELDSFKLWEYLMSTKHGLKIEQPSLCLWLHKDEYARKEHIYSGAAKINPVNRVVVSIFEELYSFSQIINRFAHEEDTDHLVEVLEGHMQGRLDKGDDCELMVVPGYCVELWQHQDATALNIGLSGF